METILAILAVINLITLVLVARLFRWAGRATTHITHLNGSAAKSAEKLNTISDFLVKQFKVLIQRPEPGPATECGAQPCHAQTCQFVPVECRFEPATPPPAPDLGPVQRLMQDVKQRLFAPAEKAAPPPQPKPRTLAPARARHPVIDERLRFHARRREKRAAKLAAQAEAAATAVAPATEEKR